MAVQDATYSKQPFQVWARLAETFSVLGRRPLMFFGFSIVVGMVLPYAIGFAVVALLPAAEIDAVDAGETLAIILSIVFAIITILTQLLLYGVLTLGAYDACTGTRRSVRTYIGTAFSRMVPLVLVLIPVGILVGIGYVLVGILGLWATAVYSAILPIVIVEKLGFRAMGRARALSKEYRWPIVGYLVILGLMLIALVLLLFLAIAALGEDTAIVVAPLLLLVVTPLSAIVTCVASAIIYARLRTIKEGTSVVELADVFA